MLLLDYSPATCIAGVRVHKSRHSRDETHPDPSSPIAALSVSPSRIQPHCISDKQTIRISGVTDLKARVFSRSPSPAPSAQSNQPQSPPQSAGFPVLETARNICSILSSLGSGGLNVPGLQAVGDIGCKIIDLAQKIKDNEGHCRSLINYIGKLVDVIQRVLVARDGVHIKNPDADGELESDIRRLKQSFEQVHEILTELSSRNWANKLLGAAGTADSLIQCKEIIAQEIETFKISSFLSLRAGLDSLITGQSSLTLKIDGLLPNESREPPKLFYGRDELVKELAELCSGSEQQNIAILGAGGLGKTSTALHVLHHADVIKKYDEHRFFVACDGVTTVDALALRILQIMQAPAPANKNPVDALRSALSVSSQTLLLLDNFESIWDAHRDHAAIRGLLETISSVTATTLMITMRAANPPPGVQWTWRSTLSTLSPEAAKDVFLAINPAFCRGLSSDDEILDHVLNELDCVPLAIHLFAQVSLGSSPDSSLKQWRKKRTQMLSLDQFTEDRLESVEVSIALSITSLDATNHPGAIQLLGMLCLLPDGLLHWEERLEIIEDTFDTAIRDLQRIQRFALAYASGEKLRVLSPIRHFVLQRHPPDLKYVQCIYNIFWKLVDIHAMADYGPDRIKANEVLNPEVGNISNLIDHAVRCNPTAQILGVAIDVSWHLHRTYPSTRLLERVSGMVTTADPAMRARFWEISGEIAYQQDRYTEATSSFTQARAHFLDTSNHLKVAHCSYMLGEIFRVRGRNPAATAMLTQARDEFLALDDSAGLGKCLKGLGLVLYMEGKNRDASAMLTKARDEFLKVGDHLGATQCLRSLCDVLYMQSEYSEASIKLMEACREFLEMGYGLGVAQCLKTLGQILQVEQKYDEASAVLMEARDDFLKIGERLGAAQCLQILGEILVTQKIFSDASATLTEALIQFQDIGDHFGESVCLELLGENFLAQGQRTKGEPLLVRARKLYLEIGMERYAARCSWKIERSVGSEAEASGFGEDGLPSRVEQSETEREDTGIGSGEDDE
ncbi:hypothetical protein HWV62_1132 [Athelia sp. TMB]|nr:hypothetical protein HWV62_1132 [Athelia sp. TMB]